MELFFVFFALLAVIEGRGPLQRFDRQPQYTEVNPNEDARLTCTVLHKKGHCSWQKDGKPVGMYPRKYEWVAGMTGGGSMDPGPPAAPPGGDCSIIIRSASLEFDDGEWECQVTSSDFSTQDALTSAPVRLVVRVPPQRPRIEYNGSQVAPGQNVSARSGERATLRCISRYGNPPARLKWMLGDEHLADLGNQTSVREQDNPKTWSASSVLELSVAKRHHGRVLSCVALHDSYPSRSIDVDVKLDVRYAPEVRLLGTPTRDVEEGRDNVELKCEADANPPANVVWRRAGRPDILSLEETLPIRPVKRADSGTYTCQARNSVGASQPLSLHLDIKYPPRILHVGPERGVTAALFSQVVFSCEAEGNPPPGIEWLHRLPLLPGSPDQEEQVKLRGTQPRLVLSNITYEHQGEYVCRAYNHIAGVQRPVQSEALPVHVKGAPQVMRRSATPSEVVATRGNDAVLRLVVCADPRPKKTTWEWGSLQLEAGVANGRHRAEELEQEARENCYEAKLRVRGVNNDDMRTYTLRVVNERGEDQHTVLLTVRGEEDQQDSDGQSATARTRMHSNPVSMMAMIGIVCAGMIILLITACVLICAYRRERCCFKPEPINSLIDGIYVKPSGGRGETQPSGDMNSEKGGGGALCRDGLPGSRRSSHGSNGGLDPPIYTTSPPRGGPRMAAGGGVGGYHSSSATPSSAEVSKVRLSPMVLQPPTRV